MTQTITTAMMSSNATPAPINAHINTELLLSVSSSLSLPLGTSDFDTRSNESSVVGSWTVREPLSTRVLVSGSLGVTAVGSERTPVCDRDAEDTSGVEERESNGVWLRGAGVGNAPLDVVGVGRGVCFAVGVGVGTCVDTVLASGRGVGAGDDCDVDRGVGDGVGDGVGNGVGIGVGIGVGDGVGGGVGAGVGRGVGCGVGCSPGTTFQQQL